MGSCGSWRGVSKWEGHSAGTHSHSGLPSCTKNHQKVQFNLNFQIFPWKVEATSSWKQIRKCHVNTKGGFLPQIAQAEFY